jgi:DNA-binding helix-hairpin-helix protein with protein kinase domain
MGAWQDFLAAQAQAHVRASPAPPPDEPAVRAFLTPTGAPCPRHVRADGTVEGDADCVSCGTCLLFVDVAWWSAAHHPGAGVADQASFSTNPSS